ncbi:MAG: ATP-binding protein [Bacteroides sp.]|nr:ATP-binding protein [Bacteroides sp.]
MKNYLLFLVWIVSLFMGANERYYFSNLSLGDGLSQITVSCIEQDAKGFMWFGTRNGLNRYDGYIFDMCVTHPEDTLSIGDNHILCMTADEKGNLWIGTNNGLNYLDITTQTFKRYYSEVENCYTLSHSTIYSIFFDEDNLLWVGTGAGLDRYDPQTDSFNHFAIDNLLEENRINAISKRKNKLYVATLKEGLIIYDFGTDRYKTYKDIPRLGYSTGNLSARSVFVDKSGNLWVGTHNSGVNLLKEGEEEFINYSEKNGLTSDKIRGITEDPDGNIVIATFNGLDIINPETRQITQYKEYGARQGNLSHYSIISVYYDKSHALWVGTYAGGICYYNHYGQKFRFHDTAYEREKILGIMGPIVETSTSLFVATEGGGLLEIDKSTGSYQTHEIFKGVWQRYGNNIIKSLCLDGDKILCGTNIGTIYSFDIAHKRFSLFYNLREERSVYYLQRNKRGDLIIGGVSQYGFCLLTREGRLINEFPVRDEYDIFFPDVRSVLEIEEHVYLIGTRNEGLYYYDYNHHTLINYRYSKSTPQGLPENYVTDIIKDSSQNIWIGTNGGGISRFETEPGIFTTYNTEWGLSDNNVCKIIEDHVRNLWISTITGISRFDRHQYEFTNYTHNNGIKVNEFTAHAGTRLWNDDIIFSGNNGLVSLSPERMSVNPFIPPVILKNLHVNNRMILPQGEDGILQMPFDNQKKIVLTYNESNFSIEYSALNYVFSEQNQYAYKLEGFDKEWNRVGSRRIAYYTNIPPGEYRFIVRGSNNDGIWNEQGAFVDITIAPPFWKTDWAYLLYTLLVASVIAFIIRYFSEKKRLQDDIRMKQVEARSREEFHQARNKLFTNFSHELRTPLTLIISPLEDITTQEDLPPRVQKTLLLMQSNCHRLLRIVNNLMDFQKKESGTMKLKVSEGDFVQFTSEMASFFKELAAFRKIRFSFKPETDSISYWFDKSLMEKVYFNFLSNAFKNVPDGGSVEITLASKSLEELKKQMPEKVESFDREGIEYIVLAIRDSGEGIATEELEKIFIPFYQVAQNKHSASGTGLGLGLSKSIIEMHHGTIWAESRLGEGATFKCILPVCKEQYKEDEFTTETVEVRTSSYKIVTTNRETPTDTERKKEVLYIGY